MQIRTALLLATLATGVGVGACGTTTYLIRPAQGGRVAVQAASGIRVVADPNIWSAEPYDLPAMLTPIAICIYNDSGQDLRVSYVDFSLTNERGFRYAAINPYLETSREPPMGRLEKSPQGVPNSRARSLVAESRIVLASAGPESNAPAAAAGAPGRRFLVRPTARYALRYYDPWPFGFATPVYDGSTVTSWNQTYYPGNPTPDVLRLGLPEGVVQNGGRISGFLYFQNAGPRSKRLQLSWTARSPGGKTLAALQFPFVIVPR